MSSETILLIHSILIVMLAAASVMNSLTIANVLRDRR